MNIILPCLRAEVKTLIPWHVAVTAVHEMAAEGKAEEFSYGDVKDLRVTANLIEQKLKLALEAKSRQTPKNL